MRLIPNVRSKTKRTSVSFVQRNIAHVMTIHAGGMVVDLIRF